jgi:MRG
VPTARYAPIVAFLSRKKLQLTLQCTVSLEDLAVQTNLDQQSCNKLREELSHFSNWLAKNMVKYFVSEYSTPNQEYIDRTRY